MTHSMTSFGRHVVDSALGQWVCEIRTVNHRYLEQSIRLPEWVRAAEMAIRQKIKQSMARGKVDVAVRYVRTQGETAFELNRELLDRLIREANEIVLQNPQIQQWRVSELLTWPEVLRGSDSPDDDTAPLLEAVDGALKRCLQHRAEEGAALQAMVLERVDALLVHGDNVKPLIPKALEIMRTNWRERLVGEVGFDSERVEQELVLQLQKWDIDEEVDRFREHCRTMQRVLKGSGAIGRRLDFLAQELNREANTIASKSGQVELTNIAVDMKVLIEQIREQVQNIE